MEAVFAEDRCVALGELLMSRWDPDSYLRFEHERALPSHDLAARIELTDPKTIVDIGCGPGNRVPASLGMLGPARMLLD
jgi:trans-aconitate 2-methyltransferase